MNPLYIILALIGYVGLLFLIAFYADQRATRGASLVRNPLIYALSLAVYCTVWTFYGSVGRAAEAGVGFLPIYLGPALFAPLWWIVLRKIILISKNQRITSVVDFLSSRYGKSTWLGVLGTVVVVVGIIPYISIQLKAIAFSFQHLTHSGRVPGPVVEDLPFFLDPGLYVAVALALFSILFGTRNLDPNERHEGLVAAIAFESIFKLVAFLTVGIFVTFGLYKGFGDLFQQAWKLEEIHSLLDLKQVGITSMDWFWLMLLSLFAVLLLPRQFHLAVVENTSTDHIGRAAWIFPLYLFLINIFVLPIAFAGKMLIPPALAEPDMFMVDLPLMNGQGYLGLLAVLGGFSAGTGMVIVSTIGLSIMISNNVVVPLLLRTSTVREGWVDDLSKRLLGIRRLSIAIVLLVAYAYFKWIGRQYTLVSVGLISFAAVAQFAPAIFIGLYWKRATRIGAMVGLSLGFLIWFYTLLLPTLAEVHFMGVHIVENGPWGISWLRPDALFGLKGMNNITHAAFWSLLLNTGGVVLVSLYTSQRTLEISQADLFVEIYKYQTGVSDYDVIRRRASLQDVTLLLNRFLGEPRAGSLLQSYSRRYGKDLSKEKMADPDLINFAETHLAGAIGAASAKLIMRSIAKEDPISLEEMFRILEQTQEIIRYSRELEHKSAELVQTTHQLRQANERLKELDRLKADFITTVTHELRTPITSIKALSKILQENPGLPPEQRDEFLGILVSESERISRLINQVLDLEKTAVDRAEWKVEPVELNKLIQHSASGFRQYLEEKQIQLRLELPDAPVWVSGSEDPLTQVFVNLISNALKFCDAGKGIIRVGLEPGEDRVVAYVADNGIGIDPKDQQTIFGQFVQVSNNELGKPTGSGLGLYISKRIIERYGGRIWVESEPGRGATFFVALSPATPG
ncbi:MAG: histidine kinase [Lewinellaceae bacterium]|nr:histidine kinase [Lewinellaceae bacterium]